MPHGGTLSSALVLALVFALIWTFVPPLVHAAIEKFVRILATTVPAKKLGFCVPHNLTALAKVKARKSSAVMWPSSTSS